jgi:hypothetical protein
LKKYKEKRKFAGLSFIKGHEMTAERIKYLDKPLYQFLNGFIAKGYLNNSSYIIDSEHGLLYGIYVNTQREDALNFIFELTLMNQKYNISKIK